MYVLYVKVPYGPCILTSKNLSKLSDLSGFYGSGAVAAPSTLKYVAAKSEAKNERMILQSDYSIMKFYRKTVQNFKKFPLTLAMMGGK